MTARAVGSVGGPAHATVGGAGRVEGPGWSLDWSVGADDRRHVPAEERSLRQRSPEPGVVETRIGVPSGDAVQRVYGVGGPGDLVVVEFENASPVPFGVNLALEGDPAVFFAHDPFPGPEGLQVPVAHRATVRMAVALAGPVPWDVQVAGLPGPGDVARAWRAHLDAGMRAELPDPALEEQVRDALVSLLVRAPDLGGAESGALRAWGLGRHAAGRRRWRRSRGAGAGEAALLAGVRARLVDRTRRGAALLPGFPAGWAGAPVEVHGAPAGRATVSFALRWHGDRPALIWEVEGGRLRLTAPALDPSWWTTDPRGETLLVAPPRSPAGDAPRGGGAGS